MELLTIQETAQLLRVNPITVRRYIAAGRLPAVRVGRGVRVEKHAAESFATPVEPRGAPPSWQDIAGEPTSADDPLWNIVGMDGDRDQAMGRSEAGSDKPASTKSLLGNIIGLSDADVPHDVSENKYKYLADAYADTHE